ERADDVAVDQPLVGAVGVADQRLAAPALDHPAPAVGDLVERLVPGDRREVALALRPDPPQRRQQARRRVDALLVALHLAAQEAAREGVAATALAPDQWAAVDGRDDRAEVRAVVRADGPDGRRHGADHPPARARLARFGPAAGHDALPADAMAEFVGAGRRGGDAGIVIATPSQPARGAAVASVRAPGAAGAPAS